MVVAVVVVGGGVGRGAARAECSRAYSMVGSEKNTNTWPGQ